MIRIITLFAFVSLLLFTQCKREAEVEEGPSRRQIANDPPSYNEMPAQQVIDMLVNNLGEKLSLAPDTKGQLRQIYLKQHLANGGNAEEIIKRGQGKEFRESLVKQTQEDVKNLLSEDEWKFYYNNIIL
jgi:hypothetical protein